MNPYEWSRSVINFKIVKNMSQLNLTHADSKLLVRKLSTFFDQLPVSYIALTRVRNVPPTYIPFGTSCIQLIVKINLPEALQPAMI
jgi:hypothetical protein